MLHDLHHEVGDRRLLMVERHEVVVALEVAIRRFDACRGTVGPLQREPGGGARRRPAGKDLLERREGTPGVIEDAVEEYSQPATVCLGHQGVEVLLGTEPGIDPEVIRGVVAVRLRFEDGAKGEPGRPELYRVVEPRDQAQQAVFSGGFRSSGLLRADEAEGIHVPPNGVLDPVRFDHGDDAFPSVSGRPGRAGGLARPGPASRLAYIDREVAARC